MNDPAQMSMAGLRALAHVLADSLASLSEAPGVPTEWRIRVAAAQARAIEDLLCDVSEPDAPRSVGAAPRAAVASTPA